MQRIVSEVTLEGRVLKQRCWEHLTRRDSGGHFCTSTFLLSCLAGSVPRYTASNINHVDDLMQGTA